MSCGKHIRAILMMTAMTFAVVYAVDYSSPGSYLAGWTEVTVTRPNSSTFSSLLFYPALVAGQNTAIDPTAGPCPAISFGHGFLQNPEKYRSTLEHLASRGYLIMASKSGLELFPNHQNFANDLRYCLDWLEQANGNPASLLYQQVDTNAFGLSGHSMGGGASILAAAADSRVRALANLAAANTNPSAIDAMASVYIPACLIAGTEDSIVPVASHGQLMYANANTPKQLPLILGGYHCGFMDSNMLFCDNGSITRAEQLAITRRLLTTFFHLYLKNDQSVWSHVWGPTMTGDTSVDTTFDPGFTIEPSTQNQSAYPDSDTNAACTLTNTATLPNQFTLEVEGNYYPTTPDEPNSPTLDPQQSYEFQVQVSLPSDLSDPQDTAVISARSQQDGATRAFAMLHSAMVLPGDMDNSGCITLSDLAAVGSYWLLSPCPPDDPCHDADVNQSGRVDGADFSSIAPYWKLCLGSE